MSVLIVGCGAQGRVLLDILRAASPAKDLEFIDDEPSFWGKSVNGARVTGGLDQALGRDHAGLEMIVAIGNPESRLRIGDRIAGEGVRLSNAIHPSAVVMPSVKIGVGNMVGATAVINTDSQVGNHAIVNTGAVVEHDCVLKDAAAVSPGAHLGGRVTLEKYAFVGTGAIVLSRVTVGEGAVIAAGAVVTRDVPERVLVKGVPGRVVEHLTESFDWTRVL
jgi:sugar O-acyltransferase (sialic acid O-acetyltransferase NeuD family)